MLQKAKVDLKPLLSSLSANKEKLKESCKCLLILLSESEVVGIVSLKAIGSFLLFHLVSYMVDFVSCSSKRLILSNSFLLRN
jgi:hypothetical protein